MGAFEVISSVTIDDLVHLAARDSSVHADLLGLGSRAFPQSQAEEQLRKAVQFTLEYEQMWHDMGCAYPSDDLFSIMPFLKHNNSQPNPHLKPMDYVTILRGFMNRWASRKHEGSAEANWYKMQDELSSKVKLYASGIF